MSYVKCNACPSQADCDEAGKCLNTLVTHRYGVTVKPVALPPGTYTAQVTGVEVQPGGKVNVSITANVHPSRPAAGTTTGRVWAIADQQLAQWPHGINKEFRRLVISACEAAGINSSTASVQYGKWLSSRT